MKKFLSLLLTGTFLFLLTPLPGAYGAEDLFELCSEVEEAFRTEKNAWNFTTDKTNNEFEEIFEKTQSAYHSYISCLFGAAFDHVLKEQGKRTKIKGELSAQINTINWMLPGQACITEDQLITSIESTSPKVLLPLALDALDDYTNFLFSINQALEDHVTLGEVPKSIQEQASSDVQRKSLLVQEARQRINNELEASLLALEVSLNSLKELRFSFVMHVRLQCILRELGSYQKMLGDIRRTIEGFPSMLKNASVNP